MSQGNGDSSNLGRGPAGIRTQDLQPRRLNIEDYLQFLRFEMGRTEGTIGLHRLYITKLETWMRRHHLSPNNISRQHLREFLGTINGRSGYANMIKTIRVFFRDYCGRPDLAIFKIPTAPFTIRDLPTIEDLRTFYSYIQSPRERTLFLMAASSGLRRSELLGLCVEDIDFDTRTIKPRPHDGKTKHAWMSFFNEEAEDSLRDYLALHKITSGRTFTDSENPRRTGGIFKTVRRKTGLDINLQTLRRWFCSELIRLNTPESYVDFFCGRTPRSILGRHYLNYSPQRLREIYMKSDLRILT